MFLFLLLSADTLECKLQVHWRHLNDNFSFESNSKLTRGISHQKKRPKSKVVSESLLEPRKLSSFTIQKALIRVFKISLPNDLDMDGGLRFDLRGHPRSKMVKIVILLILKDDHFWESFKYSNSSLLRAVRINLIKLKFPLHTSYLRDRYGVYPTRTRTRSELFDYGSQSILFRLLHNHTTIMCFRFAVD